MDHMTLTLETIRSFDTQEMARAIGSSPDQLRDGLARATDALVSATLPKDVRNVVVGGLGGSAIGGDLVRSYLADDLRVPMQIARGYELPMYVGKDTLLIVSSYSGNTEESLSMLRAALDLGLRPVCISSGGAVSDIARAQDLALITLPTGFQPRAALAYSLVAVLKTLEHAGLTASQTDTVLAGAEFIEGLHRTWGLESLGGENLALDLAHALHQRIPVIYSGCSLLDTVNYRWRGQIQENAKQLAFGSTLPEMNHNEIEAWGVSTSTAPWSAIFLRSPQDEHPRIAQRFEFLRSVLESNGIAVRSVEAFGETRMERMFSLLTLADWVSYYLAILNQVDPTAIPVMTRLKQSLH